MTDFISDTTSTFIIGLRDLGHSLKDVETITPVYIQNSLGYEVEMKVTPRLAHITFLSGIFLPVGNATFWAPKPGKLISNIGWVTKTSSKDSELWQRYAGTINSYSRYSFVPFVRVYLEVVRRMIPEEYRDSISFEKRQVQFTESDVIPTEPADNTWLFFWERYGLDKLDEKQFQVELEANFELPCAASSHALNVMAEVDVW